MSCNSFVASSPVSASPRIDSSSMVLASSLDQQLVDMLNRRVTYAHIVFEDYFLDTLTTAVARATIAQPYKAAFELKGTRLASIITTFVQRADIDVKTILTATVYLCRMPVGKIEMDSWVCERLAIPALMTAQKATRDEARKVPWWVYAAQFFTYKDISRMEREFLKLIDYNIFPSDSELLVHYDALMPRVDQCDASWDMVMQNSIFARPERTSTPACEQPSPEPSPVPHEVELPERPELAYPDSPMSESDGYSSDESTAVITPHDSLTPAHNTHAASVAHHHAYASQATATCSRLSENMHMRAAAPTSPDHEQQLHGQEEEPAAYDMLVLKKNNNPTMDARVRFYTADCGAAVLGDAHSPCFVPFSPSMSTPTLAHVQREPASGPRRGAHARKQTAQTRMRPWRRMQNWESSMSADHTWGNFGMFKNN